MEPLFYEELCDSLLIIEGEVIYQPGAGCVKLLTAFWVPIGNTKIHDSDFPSVTF